MGLVTLVASKWTMSVALGLPAVVALTSSLAALAKHSSQLDRCGP